MIRVGLCFLLLLFLLYSLDPNRTQIFIRAAKKYGVKKGYVLFSKFDDLEEFMPELEKEALRQKILKNIETLENI